MIINNYVECHSLIINWFRFICELNSRPCKDVYGYRKKFDDFHHVGLIDNKQCVYSDQEIYSPLLRKFIEEY